jgi:hypothetical protein
LSCQLSQFDELVFLLNLNRGEISKFGISGIAEAALAPIRVILVGNA